MEATQNGVERPRGRAAPPERLEEFTFEGTGRTVSVRKLSALMREKVIAAVQREPGYEKPEPPYFEVDYGDVKSRIANPKHELYSAKMAEWARKVNSEAARRLNRLLVKRAIVCDIDTESVFQVRTDMAEIGIDISDEDDLYVYVAYVCVGPTEDWTDLMRAVFERSAPSEAAIQAYKESFPGDLRREGPMEPNPGPGARQDSVQSEL